MTGHHSAAAGDFAGKGIVIAGGGQGIGAALAAAFHTLGARVVVLDRQKPETETLYSVITADLGDAVARSRAIAETDALLPGGASAFISTIGLDRRLAFGALTQDDAEMLMRVNFYAPFFTARDVMPLLRRAGGGAICLFTSRHGSEIFAPDMAGYGCAKAALDNGIMRLARAAGEANTPDNVVRVFGFCPGWVQTANQTARFSSGQFAAAAREQLVPLAMPPEGIVPAVLFAVSPQAAFLSGTIFRFDGGEGQLPADAVNSGSMETRS